MAGKRKNKGAEGVVYSTNPDFEYSYHDSSDEESLAPQDQKLSVHLEKKHRGGKTVTLVRGFSGPENELKELGRQLRQTCGIGGSVKEGEILLQGDVRIKVMDYLAKAGYTAKRVGA